MVSRSDGAAEVFNKNLGSAAHLAYADLRLLRECSKPRTPADHTTEICGEQASRRDRRKCLRALNRLISQGLLRPVFSPPVIAGEEMSEDGNARSGRATGRLELVIPTGGRVESTLRLVRSMRETETWNAETPLHVVVDGVRDPATTDYAGAIVDGINELRSGSDLSATVHSLDDRHVLIDALGDRLSLDRKDRESLEFGLFGDRDIRPATGSTRNHAFLVDDAQILLSIDDDLLCHGVEGDSSRQGVVAATNSAVEFRYWESREALLRKHRPEPINPNASVEALLGQRWADLFDREQPVCVDTNHLTPQLSYRLECCDPRVSAVVLGTVGDAGMGDSPILMTDSLRVPQLFSDDEAEQELALSSREITRVAEYPLFTCHPFFMTTACAFHTGDLLPPFFPFGRGQDGLFGLMLTQLFEDAFTGHMPLALLHDPLDKRAEKRVATLESIRLTVCRTLTILAGAYSEQTVGGTRKERLEDFGCWLEEGSDASPQAFRDWVIPLVLRSLRGYEKNLERSYYPRAEQGDTPRDRIVRALRSDIQRRIAEADIMPIVEYDALGLDTDATFKRMARHFALFGRFLQVWPRVWELRGFGSEPVA